MLRKALLSIHGIGMETADTILLYAFEHPVFVVDAYTKRVCKRSGIAVKDSYVGVQSLFMEAIACDTAIYQAYHMYIVELCKAYCTKQNPSCSMCPLRAYCEKLYLE